VRQIKTPSRKDSHVVGYGEQLGGVFALATRVSYPVETKMKAIEIRLAGVPVQEVMKQLTIRNKTQIKTWMRWYRNGELKRLEQPVGKQYTYEKGAAFSSELERVQAENRFSEAAGRRSSEKVQGDRKELEPRNCCRLYEINSRKS
jgi:transposase-like protein